MTETDVGGQLTVDHFQPQTHGGANDQSNLLYCFHRWNSYKSDYWPLQANDQPLWNPRQSPAATHFLMQADGLLYPITATGEITLRRLRLNRSPLVDYRRRKQFHSEKQRLLKRYLELVHLAEQLHQQHAAFMEEHRALLEEQRTILKALLD